MRFRLAVIALLAAALLPSTANAAPLQDSLNRWLCTSAADPVDIYAVAPSFPLARLEVRGPLATDGTYVISYRPREDRFRLSVLGAGTSTTSPDAQRVKAELTRRLAEWGPVGPISYKPESQGVEFRSADGRKFAIVLSGATLSLEWQPGSLDLVRAVCRGDAIEPAPLVAAQEDLSLFQLENCVVHDAFFSERRGQSPAETVVDRAYGGCAGGRSPVSEAEKQRIRAIALSRIGG